MHTSARSVWWNAVVNAAEVAGTDHAALLLEAADAAGLAGQTERAADLARAGLDESFTLDLTRGVEAAGRAYPLLWTADRAPELFAFATSNVLPVLDRVEPGTRARFLVTQAEHLASYATPVEMRGPATEMMAALDQIADPVLEARARVINAWRYEAYGEWDRADREYERAGTIARDADAFSMLLLVLLNHASFKTALADWDGCLKLLDAADEVGERFGLRRNLAGARCLRAFVSCMQGDLVGAWAALELLDGIFLEGLDAWERANGRGVVQLSSGEFDAVLAEVEPEAVGAALPVDSELAIEIATLTADALAWKDDIVRARQAVDAGEAAVAHHRETYSHGRLAMVGMRIEADAAVAGDASRSLTALEEAQARAAVIVDAWNAAVAPLQSSSPLVDAYSRAIDAEYRAARGRGRRATGARRRGSVRRDRDAVLRDVFSLARSRGDAFRRRPPDRNRGSQARPRHRARAWVRRPRGRDRGARSKPSAPARTRAHDGRRRRSPLRARARGASPRGRRQVESGDRVDPLHQPAHGGGSRFQHPAQDERVIPRGSHLRSAAPRIRLSNAAQ